MTKNTLLFAAIAAASLTFGGAVQAQGIRIELGDRPYYSHGPRYWAGEYEMIWVPGHWSDHGHHWIHGQYRRGEQRRWHHRDHDRARVETEMRLDDRR
jgi:hypothetical protein